MASTSNQLRLSRIRKVSGFSRPMSMWDAFFYNFLTMGVIFPWTYLWGPASFPGGNVELAIWITLLAQIPISLAYVLLSTALPVTGGDYVYQSRAYGMFGFVAVMSGFVIWILQWVALSGWLFATLGLAPICLFFGVKFNQPMLTHLGVWLESPVGIFTVSLGLALFTTLFLIRGLRLYVKIQRWLFILTVLSVGAVVAVFVVAGTALSGSINQFVATLVSQLQLTVAPGLAKDFAGHIVTEVRAAGINVSPAFSWVATLGIVPIAWTSLQWATYSVEQSTEIEDADKMKPQVLMLVGSAIAVAVCLVMVAHFEHKALDEQFVFAASTAYWAGKASPETVAFVKNVLQPFPNILAMAGTGSIFLALLIALGFLANAFQVTCNCFIGVTRIIVQMSNDGALPKWLGVVDPRRHAPVRAHWVYLIASIPVIAGYSFSSQWSTYTLGVTFACGYVFMLSAFAAAKLPSPTMSNYWKSSEIHRFPSWLIRSIGLIGGGIGAAMVGAYLVVPQFGLTGNVPYLIVGGVILLAFVIVVQARIRHPLLDTKFKKIPRDEGGFFEEGDVRGEETETV